MSPVRSRSKRLQDGDLAIEEKTDYLGKPVLEAGLVDNVNKSHRVYLEELKKLGGYTDADKKFIPGGNRQGRRRNPRDCQKRRKTMRPS